MTIDGGEGNYYVTGFNKTSTLRIGDGSDTYYVKINEDGDYIVIVGKQTINLEGAASLSAIHIKGEEIFFNPEWTLSGTKHFHPISINNAGTATTLKAAYNKDEFNFADFGSYGSTIVTVDASAVERDLKITGILKQTGSLVATRTKP